MTSTTDSTPQPAPAAPAPAPTTASPVTPKSATAAHEGRGRRLIPALLRVTEFRRYWTGQTISAVGDQITGIVLPLVAVSTLHADAGRMGLLTAAGWLPSLLFALHAGTWADGRSDRRRVMIVADVARAVLLLTVPAAHLLGVLTLTQLFVVAFVMGGFSVLFDVCNAPLFVAVVPNERYVEGNSLVNGSRAMSSAAGPGLGGGLVQLLAAPLALVADALSFLASALALGSIRPTEPPAEPRTRGRISAGLRFITATPIMRAALLGTATVNLFTFMIAALFVLFATTELGLSAGLLGTVLSAGALGGLLGAGLTGRISRRIGIGRAVVLGLIAYPAPLLLVPAARGGTLPVVALLLAAVFLSGIGVMILDITVGSLFAAVIPDRLRSRVSGAYQAVNYGIRPLGSLLGGVLGSTLGLRPALWVAAVGALTSFLWLLPSPIPGLRSLPDAQEEKGL
ncbi:putative MFS family arabinose efflux permease [Streptomyces sp. TLI_235]|nr:MFS transporter [Streptomyces sp. TLI_235]PBC76448.1 putative MFS family arabinose efflux permease [Streptomyces sp. TLI_235]